MISVTFSEEAIKRIGHESYYNKHAHIRRRMNALWLKSCGLKHKDICRLAQVSSTTLSSYLERYQQEGLDQLLESSHRIAQSELEKHSDVLNEYFEKNPPRTMKEAAHKIEELTGIKRSSERVRVFLKKQGLKFRKVGMVPAKADPGQQEAFKKNT